MQIAPAQFQVLVTRPMIYTLADGTNTTLFVDIGMPYLIPPDNPANDPAWGCQFQTRGFASDELHTVYGVDGVQALYLALALAGTRIAALPESLGLDWGGAVNFGFPPRPKPIAENVGG